jgi:Phosducin
MADPAREEVDRLFASHDHPTSHPEDLHNRSDRSDEEEGKLASKSQHSFDSNNNDDYSKDMATMTQTKTNYHIPTTTHYANTGPKGVIADAQSFERAKQTSFRSRLANIANNISFKPQSLTSNEKQAKSKAKSGSSNSDLDLSEEDSDSEFMKTWRQTRINELAQNQIQGIRRVSPTRRTWGTLSEVDANGYLDAIEKVTDEDVVIVMINDSSSMQSRDVEDELGMLAYRYSAIRFVKLDQEVAEMESVQVPAVLAYRAGDVFATISDAKAEGLEDILKKSRVLPS